MFVGTYEAHFIFIYILSVLFTRDRSVLSSEGTLFYLFDRVINTSN